MEKIGGVMIPWNEVGELLFGRPVRHIAYAITREAFARWD